MAYLQVRDFPEELHEQLRLIAKKEHRSVSQQTIVAIEQYVNKAFEKARPINVFSTGVPRNSSNENYLERRKKVFERIAQTPKPDLGLTQESIVATIHEGRAERDARIGL